MLLLGVVQAQAAGGVAGAGSYDLLATEILTGSQASVTFSSLGDYASTYQHLQIRAVARASNGNIWSSYGITMNGDSGSNYSAHRLYGNGSSVGSEASTSQTRIFDGFSFSGSSASAGAFGSMVTDVLDPYKTTKYTTIRLLGGRATPGDNPVALISGLWMNTASLTSITLTGISGSFVAGSRFSIYGLRSA